MRRPILLAVSLLAAALWAQEQVPPPDSSAADVIHINVNLVQIDAVVTDAKGNHVPTLKASDFEVLQDGKPQAITNFSYVSLKAPTAVAASMPKNLPKGAVAPPPVPLKPEQARRMIALVVDDLGLSFTSTYYTRNAIKKFVDEQMEPGDMVAIVRTGAGMGALQQFTADKRMLYAAIDRIRFNSLGRVGADSVAPLGPLNQAGPGDAEREQIFSAGSLGSIRYVVDGLRDMPGRKALVLFSENMRLFYADGQSPRVQQALQDLTDAANRSSVVVYTIDPRGLQTHQLTAADDTRGMTPAQISNVSSERAQQEFNSRDGLVLLAKYTGGTFQYNTNDVAGALRKAVADTEGYYLIGYHPAANTFDAKTGQPKFHKVEVKLKTPGLAVRSRSGFLGRSDALKPELPRGRDAEMLRALTSPFASGSIHMRLTTLYSQGAQGAYLSALLHIDAKDLKFTDQPDAWHRAQIDISAITFGDNGQAVGTPVNKTYTVQLKNDAYRKALGEGFLYSMVVPLKKPGAYQVRVALRDSQADQIGSASQFIDVPDASKGKLTLSSIVLREFVPTPAAGAQPPSGVVTDGSPVGSPAVRVFTPGQELAYGYQILNAKGPSGQEHVEAFSRVFRDGQEIFSGKPVDMSNASAAGPRKVGGGVLKLGDMMRPGDYVLQVIVTDKSNNSTASQWVDFEVK